MPTPNTRQDITAQIKSLQTKIGKMHESARLTNALDTIEDMQTTINGLAQHIANLRTGGYVFEKNMETEAKNISTTWQKIYPNLQAQISSQSSMLVNALRPVELQISRLVAASSNPLTVSNQLSSLQTTTDQLEEKIKASQKMIEGMYDGLNGQLTSMKQKIDKIEYLLKNLSEASFTLFPTESGIMAVKAVWCKTGQEKKDDPEGILFLTDQRILFEQKEEIATKKKLFITTEKKKIQTLLIDVPATLVDRVQTIKMGLLRNEDHIEIHFQSNAPIQFIHLHIWQDCTLWQSLLNRAKMKDYESNRTAPLDKAVVDKVRSAPTQCPACGGAITKPVLRGQDTIKCEFCGFEIRL